MHNAARVRWVASQRMHRHPDTPNAPWARPQGTTRCGTFATAKYWGSGGSDHGGRASTRREPPSAAGPRDRGRSGRDVPGPGPSTR